MSFIAGLLLPGLTATPTAAVDPVTITDGSQVSVRMDRTVTGTGHGTTAACFLNAANGYDPGDETPLDEYVCIGDTVTYDFTLSTPAVDTDQTVRWAISIPPLPRSTTLLPESGFSTATQTLLRQVCENTAGTYGGYRGRVVALTSTQFTCDVGLRAGTGSGTANFNMVFDINSPPLESTGPTIQPQVTIGSTSGQAEPFTVLSTIKIDTFMKAPTAPPQYQVIDGTAGMLYTFDVVAGHSGTAVGYHNVSNYTTVPKGLYTGAWVAPTVTVDVSGFPEGTVFGSTNDVFVLDPATNTMTATNRGGSTAYAANVNQTTVGTITAFVPVDQLIGEGAKTLSAHITRADMIPAPSGNRAIYYPINYNGAPEPGLDQPATYNTAGVLGPYTLKGSVGADNNDWAVFVFHQEASWGPNEKLLRFAEGHVYSSGAGDVVDDGVVWLPSMGQSSTLPAGGTPFWAVLSLRAYPAQVESVAFCDYWTSNATTDKNRSQDWDLSRDPYVEVWDDVNRTWVTVQGTWQYRSTGNTSPTTTLCNRETGWSDTPSADTNMVRVVIEGPITLSKVNPSSPETVSGSNLDVLRAFIPLKTSVASHLPAPFPTGYVTITDTSALAYNGE